MFEGFYNSRVTVELGRLIDQGVKLWDFEYPSYYEGEEKKKFEQKVIDHYYFRQIGQETTGRFLHMFRSRIREIMPYYVQLYESEALMKGIEDPFGNVDIVETYKEESTGNILGTSGNSVKTVGTSTSKGNATSGSNRTHKESDTPQGSIDNLETYMSGAAKDEETGTESSDTTNTVDQTDTSAGTSTQESAGSVEHTLTRKGNQGVNTYAHDMKELRETFLNIDLMIIKDLNDLFLGIY